MPKEPNSLPFHIVVIGFGCLFFHAVFTPFERFPTFTFAFASIEMRNTLRGSLRQHWPQPHAGKRIRLWNFLQRLGLEGFTKTIAQTI